MLKHRVGNIALKSETLPRYEGQDEEGEALLESAFDLMQITNSCPDLSIIVDANENQGAAEPARHHHQQNHHNNHYRDNNVNIYVTEHNYPCNQLTVRTDDHVDGRYFSSAAKIPLGFRRSTSLNSLEADGSGDSNAVKVGGKLEHKEHYNILNHQNTSDFIRSTQRSSYNGPPTGYLQKSISTPSVTQGGRPLTEEQLRHLNQCYQNTHIISGQQQLATGSQNSSKRSFFRRKHKSKSGSLNSHPPVVVQQYKRNSAAGLMMSSSSTSSTANSIMYNNNGSVPVLFPSPQDPVPVSDQSPGYSALIDPSLRLQDRDPDCWAKFMTPEVVSQFQLSDKDQKRQEHMYEFIVTEKHHCQTLALMNHLFLFGMRNNGYGREATILFPGLQELLQVHVAFFRELHDKQIKCKEMGRPLESISDLIAEQFTAIPLSNMIRLYGLLCAGHEKSLELFKNLKTKDPKFANLVNSWNRESMLARKNVPECLLLVAQRITKYPLLIEALAKTSLTSSERDDFVKALLSAKELNARVNERVDERQKFIEICQRIDSKSYIADGHRRIRRDELTQVPSRRLRFHGQAIVNCNRVMGGNTTSMVSGGGIPTSIKNMSCHVLILTDYIVLMQEINGKLFFVAPPGLVRLSNMIVREKAGLNSSLFLVLGTGSNQPEMIELQVMFPQNRDDWIDVIMDAKAKYDVEVEVSSDLDDDVTLDPTEVAEYKTNKVLEELQEHDRQILMLLKSRANVINSLRQDRPHMWRVNTFDGKDDILNALATASDEVQRVMKTFDDGSATTVNRSVSCASEHPSAILPGLPRRADTFGGFDSQQRSCIELSQSQNNKVLLQMVVQLSEVCGELFQQIVPNLTVNVQQSLQLVAKKSEAVRLRELTVQSDVARMNEAYEKQKEEISNEKAEMALKRSQLNTDAADVSHQREQLYRKLEKLENKGRNYLDPVSPVAVNTNEKPTTGNIVVAARRSPSAASGASASGPNNKLPPKQQLPLHLAAFSSSKSAANTADKSKLQHAGSFQGGTPPLLSSQSVGEMSNLSRNNSTAQLASRMSPRSNNGQSAGTPSVQQMLPLRLSEGNPNSKSSTLPRDNGGSQTNLSGNGQAYENQATPMTQKINNNNGYARIRNANPNHFLQHSKSSASILTRNPSGESSIVYGSSGPNTDRMSNYYRDAHAAGQPNNGHGAEYTFMHNAHGVVPVVHRRSGSSPVPMSATTFQHSFQQQMAAQAIPSDDDYDSNKILFL